MKRITFFIISILCFTACNNEIVIEQPIPEQSGQIELIMPDAEKVSVYSTAKVSECTIDTLWVIAFRGAGKIWAEKIDVSKIVKNGQAIQLLPQLVHHKQIEDGDSLYIIANVSPITNASLPDTASITKDNINEKFLLNKAFYLVGDYLPMFGKMAWSSYDFTCTMTRAVAKVQIRMGETVSDVTGNFSANNVSFRIYNFGNVGHVKPGAGGAIFGAIASPGTIRDTGNPQFSLIQKAGATDSETTVYLHEYPTATRTGIGSPLGSGVSNKTFNADRQYIILDKVDGSSNHTYYRLDFYNRLDSTFYDTKRNNHYIFTINKVRSEGYSGSTGLAQAQSNAGSNIEYTVQILDDSKHITSNGQYAIVSNVDTAFVSTTGPQPIAIARYVLPAGVALSAGIVNTATATGTGITPATLSPLTATNQTYTIDVTSASTGTKGYLTFKLGNITHTVVIAVK